MIDKLPMRTVYTPDRPAQDVQAVMRQASQAINGMRKSVALEEYADTGDWGDTLSATSSATFADTAVQRALTFQPEVGDALVVVGRANVGTDAGVVGQWQLAVYEGKRTQTTQKPGTLMQVVAGTNNIVFPFACLHTVTKPGSLTVALQSLVVSGVGNVYTFARAAFVVEVWRA